MQTFLPYADFEKSLSCLDYKRLGKQRVEAMQIINSLEKGGGWKNHPATLMWKGYIEALKLYCNTAIKLWVERGYKNTMKLYDINNNKLKFPFWFGNNKLHDSHKAMLFHKNPEFYSVFQDFQNITEYFWVVTKKTLRSNNDIKSPS